MASVTLKTELRHELKLTPQILQSMKVLQMNSQELVDYLGKLSEENPVLEQADTGELLDAYSELRRKVSWLDGGVPGTTFAHKETFLSEPGAADRETESLSAFLRDQLERLRLDKPLLALSEYLAELVDDDGYLTQEDLDSLSDLGVPQTLADQALETLQSLEPAGVGARSLSECLLLQLRRMEDVPSFVPAIVERFLSELSRKHYGPISRELGITQAEITAAEQIISLLEPHPGSAFQPAEPTVYVRPDVFVVELDGKLQVILNEYYLPRITVSPYYEKLFKESEDAETRKYLHQKLQQAKWLLNSLDRRGSTVFRCAEAILNAQLPFFRGETTELAPMNLSALAESLELHPSTVSRAVRDKYLQCRQGTFPLRYFFSRAVGQEAVSRQAVKQRLAVLIRDEDPRHPLSDQTLCKILRGDGVDIARRTVAKYREELGIGSSTVRKKK